jgi:hypothetical protein
MLTAISHTGRTGSLYIDPRADYFTRLHPGKAKDQAVASSNPWGITPAGTAQNREVRPPG